MMIFLLLGLPGVGKGTIARKLKKDFDFEIFSTGEILREEIRNNTLLGQKAKPYVSEGNNLPDEIIINLLKERLSPSKNVVIVGFPRNVVQAKALDDYLNENDKKIDLVINFNASEKVLKDRIRQRLFCTKCSAVYHLTNFPPKVANKCNLCGSELSKRADDDEAFLDSRLNRYIKASVPLLEYYSKLDSYKEIDANEPLHDVYYDVLANDIKFA